MTQPMISEQWARFVLPIVRKEWFQQMTGVIAPVMSLFGVDSSTASVEYSQGIGSGGLVPEYNAATAEGHAAAIEYDRFNPLYEKTFTHKEYAKGIAIERKLWDDDQKGNIRRRASSLGIEFGQTRAYHAASVFNNAFATVTGADSVYLCSASHPYSPTNSSTWSNLGTSALSYTSIVSTLQAGRRMVNDRGLPMPILYDTIVVPVELEETAAEILKAIAKPGTADNDGNALGNLRVMADPYLTDTNNWFAVDSAQARIHLLWYNRVMPELNMDPASNFNLVARYAGYMRYSYGWDDAHFIYGHNVT